MDDLEALSIEELKVMLERLTGLDQQLQVFGAQIHQYKSYPLSDIELELLEVGLRVRLPADYRQFLQQIGYGAGPYYGLLSPEKILSNLMEKDNGGMSSAWPPRPDQPFPISWENIEECILKKDNPWIKVEVYWPTNGCIPICFEGCTSWDYLITEGELKGSVVGRNEPLFDPCHPILEDWILAPQPPSILDLHRLSSEPMWGTGVSHLPTFSDWYGAWLRQCLSDFDELMQKQMAT